ncbi:unnamed protein product [Caenorhabditis sp. 36 PRJEB53466]|nr:unnamed protein product [Caenorhabditis sp. 36 PRJEB53466]
MSPFLQLVALFIILNDCRSYVVVVEPGERIEEVPALSDPVLLRKRKSILVGLSEQTEEVCKTKIRQNYRPQFGHIANGSRVEIQQDEESFLEATFVECLGENRPPCHGVDHDQYISECVTVYEHRPANVRVAKSSGPYYPATVRDSPSPLLILESSAQSSPASVLLTCFTTLPVITAMRISFLLLVFLSFALACDIIVHLKSDTDKKFSGQLTASNGKKSERWSYLKKLQKNTFQQKADECGLKDWEISTWDETGKPVASVKVTLDGIGRVTYKVGDDLKPVQKDRQGAVCKGQCAPL